MLDARRVWRVVAALVGWWRPRRTHREACGRGARSGGPALSAPTLARHASESASSCCTKCRPCHEVSSAYPARSAAHGARLERHARATERGDGGAPRMKGTIRSPGMEANCSSPKCALSAAATSRSFGVSCSHSSPTCTCLGRSPDDQVLLRFREAAALSLMPLAPGAQSAPAQSAQTERVMKVVAESSY